MNRHIVLVAALSALGAIVAPTSAAPPVIDVPAIVTRVLPAVVSVTTRHVQRDPGRAPVFRRGLGSGVIVDAHGYIVTNHHVIEDAAEIRVALRGAALVHDRGRLASPRKDAPP